MYPFKIFKYILKCIYMWSHIIYFNIVDAYIFINIFENKTFLFLIFINLRLSQEQTINYRE